MNVLHLDEGGHSSGTRVVAMGGILGSDLDLPRLSGGWLAMLKRHHCTTFHMADLESVQGEFKGWTKQQKEALLKETFDFLQEFPLCYVGVAIATENHRSLAEVFGTLGGVFIDPWFFCFQLAVSTAARLTFARTNDPSPAAPIAVIHDQQSEYQGRAADAFRFLQDTTDYGPRLGTCQPGDKTKAIPLQVADLVAYETRKLFENAIYDSSRAVRWPMQQLLKHRMAIWNYADLGGVTPRIPEGAVGFFRRSYLTEIDGELKLADAPRE